jgi:hypothetical protein
MDETVYAFLIKIELDKWKAVEVLLPDGLDIAMLQYFHDTVHAIIHAFDGMLDDSLFFVGRLAEINRRLEGTERQI